MSIHVFHTRYASSAYEELCRSERDKERRSSFLLNNRRDLE